ncbi:YraN family protein [Chitinophaga vietnamensis]|uniref:YraN family protein n=1 Tax=Chitinophaga vietnamensis TaxID=2593957 RepID=UPI0011777997|nr:YraN family protein [Chitinophaga vietnamensis]
MKRHLRLGQQGERLALAYVRRYCDVLHTNWKYGRKEIDIIAARQGVIYFIEVKTRSSKRFGFPEQAVDHRKEAHIREVAEAYLRTYDLQPAAIRFDIISVIIKEAAMHELIHLRDVF